MPVSHPEFGPTTEAVEAAAAFPLQCKGKIILVTGASLKGLGGAAAAAFATQEPKMLILAGRSLAKVEAVVHDLRPRCPNTVFRPLVVDLSAQHSVRAAAGELMGDQQIPQIDILINNAGIMNLPKLRFAEDSHVELQFATNHLGHFLLTALLLPKLLKSAAVSPKGATRIVNVSSFGARYSPVRFSDYNFAKAIAALPADERPNLELLVMSACPATSESTYVPMVAYGQSKSANILFSLGLTKRLYDSHGILSVALHPGVIETELGRHLDPEWLPRAREQMMKRGNVFKTLAAGAATTIIAALDPKVTGDFGDGGSGVFWSDCNIVEAPDWATSAENAEKLWKLSAELVGVDWQ